MSNELLIANLLRLAKDDLDAARLLADAGNRNASDLCEQSAEKIVRAVLTSEARHARPKSLLDEMVDAIPDDNPIKPLLRDVEHLATYATVYRYPTAVRRMAAAPTGAGVHADVAKVEAALREAVSRFGVDLARPGSPATTAAPIR